MDIYGTAGLVVVRKGYCSVRYVKSGSNYQFKHMEESNPSASFPAWLQIWI